jgi:hypothetical protein
MWVSLGKNQGESRTILHSGDTRGEFVSLLFPALEAAYSSWLMAPSTLRASRDCLGVFHMQLCDSHPHTFSRTL